MLRFLQVQEFFKTELSNLLLKVEDGFDFEKAKEQVLSYCALEVKSKASAKSDKECVCALIDLVKVDTKEAEKAINPLQHEFKNVINYNGFVNAASSVRCEKEENKSEMAQVF